MDLKRKKDFLNVRGVTYANMYLQTQRVSNHHGMGESGKYENTLHVSRKMLSISLFVLCMRIAGTLEVQIMYEEGGQNTSMIGSITTEHVR